MLRLIVSSMIVLITTCALVAQQATKPSATVSPMSVRTFQGCTFLHRSIETDMQSSAARIEEEMKALGKAMQSAQIMPAGAPIFVFHNPTPEAGKTFTIEMGFPVGKDTQAPEGTKVRALEPLKAATVMFMGAPTELRGAYERLYQEIGASGATPGTELRQMTLNW